MKKLVLNLGLILMLSMVNLQAFDKVEAGKATGATVAGAGIGYGVVAATGVTAASFVGGGTGIGAAAGPVGAAIGATVGLAAYGVYKVFSSDEKKFDNYSKINKGILP